MGDACSLVDAVRAGELSPLEALADCIAAIDASPLNALSFMDFDRARDAAARADVALPFGGVPFDVKELEKVAFGSGRRQRGSPRRHVESGVTRLHSGDPG
jgi:aspartyl-tRNA(Asn)/glutamyl-tRNA(Gln) amidotransferase subunit A